MTFDTLVSDEPTTTVEITCLDLRNGDFKKFKEHASPALLTVPPNARNDPNRGSDSKHNMFTSGLKKLSDETGCPEPFVETPRFTYTSDGKVKTMMLEIYFQTVLNQDLKVLVRG